MFAAKKTRLKYRTVLAKKAGNSERLLALAPVVQNVDSAIHWIVIYPVAIGFPNTYPLDSDLSGG